MCKKLPMLRRCVEHQIVRLAVFGGLDDARQGGGQMLMKGVGFVLREGVLSEFEQVFTRPVAKADFIRLVAQSKFIEIRMPVGNELRFIANSRFKEWADFGFGYFIRDVGGNLEFPWRTLSGPWPSGCSGT